MHLLSMGDLSSRELESLITETDKIKKRPQEYRSRLDGKVMLMLFEKPSTRTRISFEAAILQLGGNAIDLDENVTQLGRGETIKDSARVLSRYADCIVARVRKHATLIELAANATIPVINGLSDLEHPCQIISDLFTIYEASGKLHGINLTYVGDGNNVCNSLVLGCAIAGVNLTVATPKGYEPKADIVKKAVELSKKTGSKVTLMNDPKLAVKDADFLYTDVWVSMGFEAEEDARMKAFKGYQLNSELLKLAKKDCRIMHCLPAHRGLEITDDVIDSKSSIVWDQAENRMHAQKAILLSCLSS
jgi:ornithine carbamoyltransferase